jgi:hypothetical protein
MARKIAATRWSKVTESWCELGNPRPVSQTWVTLAFNSQTFTMPKFVRWIHKYGKDKENLKKETLTRTIDLLITLNGWIRKEIGQQKTMIHHIHFTVCETASLV